MKQVVSKHGIPYRAHVQQKMKRRWGIGKLRPMWRFVIEENGQGLHWHAVWKSLYRFESKEAAVDAAQSALDQISREDTDDYV
jgi:ATP:corrinoid adenosyltransferase